MASCSTLNNKTKSFGGLRINNINAVNRKFFCEWCTLLLLYPWQTLCCGTLLCRWCFLNGLSNKRPFTCPFCNVKQPNKEGLADRGAAREMKTISIVCYSCPWNGSYDTYLDHLQKQHADLECLDCHERFPAVNLSEEHRQELCPERSISCGLPNCADSIKHYNMNSHYMTKHHQENLVSIAHKRKHRRDRKKKNGNLASAYQNFQESLTIVRSTYEILHNDFLRTNADLIEVKTNTEAGLSKVPELRNLGTENENTMREIIVKHNGMEIEMDKIKKSQEEGGILILDTNSTTVLPANLPTTKPFSITLRIFKTSQYGYTFKVRLCSITVDKEEYVSLSLCLLNGEYYNLLPFPFPYDIHAVLWDQSNRQSHILTIFKSSLTSSAFHRPTSEMNEEFTISKFCSLQYLTNPENGYVRDGVFFIRIFVDFLNTGCNPFQLNENNQESGMSTD